MAQKDSVPCLVLEDLSKDFGGLRAVDGVNLRIEPGERHVLMGPNGAGKTTLFNVITGFIPPTDGHVLFGGTPLRGIRPHKLVNLGIARTFQLCRPFVGMSVLENVMVPCYAPRAAHSATSARARALDILGRIGLARRADLPAELLSYGDQRRLEIARALATDPKLLLLDEPFAGLGSAEIEPIAALIRGLHRERGLAILIIEHKLREFMQLVQRVVALDFGEVIATGPPQEIVKDQRVVEAYIGKTGGDLGAA